MVQTAVTDIVGPTVTAQNPYGFADEVIGQAQNAFAGFTTFGGTLAHNFFELCHAFALFFHANVGGLVGI